jgi:hypothetical protein
MPIVHRCASADCTTLTMGEFCNAHESAEAASPELDELSGVATMTQRFVVDEYLHESLVPDAA